MHLKQFVVKQFFCSLWKICLKFNHEAVRLLKSLKKKLIEVGISCFSDVTRFFCYAKIGFVECSFQRSFVRKRHMHLSLSVLYRWIFCIFWRSLFPAMLILFIYQSSCELLFRFSVQGLKNLRNVFVNLQNDTEFDLYSRNDLRIGTICMSVQVCFCWNSWSCNISNLLQS